MCIVNNFFSEDFNDTWITVLFKYLLEIEVKFLKTEFSYLMFKNE